MIDGMMASIKLESRNHELVGYTKIPAFMVMPDVVIWGDRFFECYEISAGSQDHHVYRECFAVAVVEPVTDTPPFKSGEENASEQNQGSRPI